MVQHLKLHSPDIAANSVLSRMKPAYQAVDIAEGCAPSRPQPLTDEDTSSTEHAKGEALKDDTWLFELLGLALGLLAFSGVICIFAFYDDQPLTRWKPSSISINTVVSILGNTTRASLAFVISTCIAQGKWNWFKRHSDHLIAFDRLEDASKGLWGSLRLLSCLVKRPHWLLLGATTTIVLLGFEPFLQALINYDDGVIALEYYNTSTYTGNLTTGAEIGRCDRLDVGSLRHLRSSSLAFVPFPGPNGEELVVEMTSAFEIRVDLGMMAAIWNGFSPLLTAQNLWPSFTCLTGNCTWSPYASLEVCSSCHDITERLQKRSGRTRVPYSMGEKYTDGPPPDVSHKGVPGYYKGLEPDEFHQYTKYEIPEIGLNISNFDGPPFCVSEPGRKSDTCPDTYLTARMVTNPGQTLNFQDLQTLIFAVQMTLVDDSWKRNITRWEDTRVTAEECALYFCVQAHNTQSEKGVLVDEVIGTWTNKTPGSFGDSVEEWDRYTNYTLNFMDYGGDRLRNDLQLYIPTTNDEALSHLQGETFNVSQGTIVSMLDYITHDFNIRQNYTYSMTRDSPVFDLWVYPSLGYLLPPGFILGLGESTDTTQTFKNAALSLSKWMRDLSLRDSPLNGEVTQATVVIRVRWEYLIWPATTVLAGLCFAMLSIWETKRLGMPAWKGSVLATLAYGSDPTIRERLKDAAVAQGRDTVARKMKVRLEYPDGQANMKHLDDDDADVTLVR